MYICVLICMFLTCASGGSVTVVTSAGSIVGQREDGYDTYFGVPYAKVDENNPFGNTLVYPKFETPFIANDSSILCPQSIFKVSDTLQCLRLNIYVPHTTRSSKKLPILVWFHGGGFAFGSGGEYGAKHLVKRGIIVITVNYRLGPYGFLCLDDPTVPGNQGMKDQIEALRWIKKYIGAFNGNPNKVTIAGESYGGGAVDLHLYSEYEMLFDKAIVQSGSIFDEGFYVKPDKNAAIKIAQHLGHRVNETKDALKELANENPRSVMSAALNLSLPMCVCKEKRFPGVNNFVASDPFHLEKAERIRNTKIMIGYTSMELLFAYANQTKDFWDKLGNVFVEGLKRNFIMSSDEYTALGDILKKFYLGAKEIGPNSIIELSESASDFVVNHAEERSIDKYMQANMDAHNAKGKVYKYMFSYIGGSTYKDIPGSGAAHTEELKYLFDWETPIAGAEQTLIRSRMTALWANFVKYGNPTPSKTQELPVLWTPVIGKSRPYLNIDVEMSMKDQAYNRRMAFWDLMWKTYEKKSSPVSGSQCVALPLQMQGWASPSKLITIVPKTVVMWTFGGGIQNPTAGSWQELAVYPLGQAQSSTPRAGSDLLRPGIAVSRETLRTLDEKPKYLLSIKE
ncbi:unnamed protein product [Arctia plantaginis]|uniref:Carboxylesterase type B domain-containing protein n=1 Tax=Arctia plantaginis TaxID=874455 RepID=A0A8S0ZE71_ARCPL|nr:unnamed protein product [Arctia plantaginis]